MNVEDNVTSQNWEDLLSTIHEECRYGGIHVELDDSEADRYDFANEILMRRMRERLVETLERTTYRVLFSYLTFGNKFFMTMNEEQQQSFFNSIFNLPVTSIDIGRAFDNTAESPAAITMSTSALLETLPQLHTDVERLYVTNFALTRESDVQAVSNFILAKIETIESLAFESVECPVDGYTKQESDESDGFLDPLLRAASGLDYFSVSTKTRSVHSTLVSPRALRALFLEGDKTRLSLRGLGLTDRHVLVIVDGLPKSGIHLGYLNLESNPGITAQGYGALLNLINRANVIGYYQPPSGKWCGFGIDDKAWEGKLNLVCEMNWGYKRMEYLTNGSFSSEERRWQWLEWVVKLPSFYDEDEEDRSYDEEDSSYDGGGAIEDEAVFFEEDEEDRSYDEEDSSYDGGGAVEDEAVFNDEDEEDRSYGEEDSSYDEGGAIEVKAVWDRKIEDAKRINFIWYLLRENPEMMQTSNDMFRIL